MAQKRLALKNERFERPFVPEFAEVVGLRCDNDLVTLRFTSSASTWGQPARQVQLNRKLAEQLSRILDQELFADE